MSELSFEDNLSNDVLELLLLKANLLEMTVEIDRQLFIVNQKLKKVQREHSTD